MSYLILIIKGFIIGLAKIIPGVSGAVLSISLGVYERLINILSNPLKIKMKDIKFLFFLSIGTIIGITLLCNLIMSLLKQYSLETMMLFVGLIVGGLPEIITEIKKEINIKNIIIFIISSIIIIILTNLNKTNNQTNHFFLMGMIESLTTIIPGISGTAIFMALGWYESLITTIKNILTFNSQINVSILFISGFVISTLLISKIINFIFKNHKIKAYYSIMGFMVSSILTMLQVTFKNNYNILELLVSIILLFIGILFTGKINNLLSNSNNKCI